METEEVIVNGKKETIVTKLPEDYYEDYEDINLDDTIDLIEVLESVREINE